MIRITKEELARVFPQAFLSVLEGVGPRRVKFRITSMTGIRNIAGDCVREIGDDAHMPRELP